MGGMLQRTKIAVRPAEGSTSNILRLSPSKDPMRRLLPILAILAVTAFADEATDELVFDRAAIETQPLVTVAAVA